MSQKRKGSTAAGLSCGQMFLLFLIVVGLALAAALALGSSLGVFNRVIPGFPSMQEPTSTTDFQVAVETSATLITVPDAAAATVTPALLNSPSPVMTETVVAPLTPTITPTPPPTAPPNVCAQLDLRMINATSNIVAWRVDNGSGQPFTINQIEMTWPSLNDAIFNAFLDGNVIWSGQDLVSPTIINTWFADRGDRTVVSVSRLEFFFGTDALASGYELSLRFENGCEVTRSG